MPPMSTSTSPSTARRMLVAFAHPDDETFGLGGAIARYADAGVDIDLICATNGDVGKVAHGGYGHPDHIAIHRATLRAFHTAGDPNQYTEQIADGLEPYRPARLYYTVFPRAPIRAAVFLARLTGRDPRHMGQNKDLDFRALLDATLPIHARLDLRAFYDRWQDASDCHASQVGPRGMMPLPRFVARWLFGWQSFHRAWPEEDGSRVLERDLFEGVE
jgi:LmbE family N-acetylglucosaminyl deacetylase